MQKDLSKTISMNSRVIQIRFSSNHFSRLIFFGSFVSVLQLGSQNSNHRICFKKQTIHYRFWVIWTNQHCSNLWINKDTRISLIVHGPPFTLDIRMWISKCMLLTIFSDFLVLFTKKKQLIDTSMLVEMLQSLTSKPYIS